MIRFSQLSIPVLAGMLVTTALPAQAHHWSGGQSYPHEPAVYPTSDRRTAMRRR